MSNTAWHMDIEIYAIDKNGTLSLYSNPGGNSPTPGRWDYGPISFQENSIITLESFLVAMRDAIENKVLEGYPWFGVYATPYLMPAGSHLNTSTMGPSPLIQGDQSPTLRKLGTPAWSNSFDPALWPPGFDDEFRRQLIVRYDITANRTDMHNEINGGDPELTYYGFKILFIR